MRDLVRYVASRIYNVRQVRNEVVVYFNVKNVQDTRFVCFQDTRFVRFSRISSVPAGF